MGSEFPLPPIVDATVLRPTGPDHARVQAVLPHWWPTGPDTAGPDRLAALAQRLFFEHFAAASLLVESDGELVGFLIGFLSESHPDEAYIHLVGVAPEARGTGLARYLYAQFFDYARAHDRTLVRAITSPGNTGSYAFHTSLGFTADPGPGSRPIQPDYDGPGADRITFRRPLS